MTKWHQNRCLRDATLAQPTDTARARRSIHESFHRFNCVLEPNKHMRSNIIHGLLRIMRFSQLGGDYPLIYDCVTRENYWRITPLVTKSIIIHGKPYTILYDPYFSGEANCSKAISLVYFVCRPLIYADQREPLAPVAMLAGPPWDRIPSREGRLCWL